MLRDLQVAGGTCATRVTRGTVLSGKWLFRRFGTYQPKNGSSFQRRGAVAQSNAEKKWIVVKRTEMIFFLTA